MEIEVVVDAGAIIGESPTWVAAENALYWIDVKKPALNRYEPSTAGQRSWALPSDIGAFALAADLPGAVVALRTGMFRLDFRIRVADMPRPAAVRPGAVPLQRGGVRQHRPLLGRGHVRSSGW